MTRADLDDRLRRYTPTAKISVVLFGIAMLSLQAGVATALFLGPKHGLATPLLCLAALVVGTAIGLVIWRRVVHFLAARYGLTCPACGKNLLGKPAEPLLMDTGRCHFCGATVVPDVTPMA